MRSRHVTIAGLMGVVLVCAIGLAALRAPTLLWTQITTSVALTSLLVATLGAIRGRDRAFWLGFAIWGWAYAIISLGPWFAEEVRPVLLTTRMLDELFFLLESKHAGPTNVSEFIRFQSIGHALFCFLHGLVGGLVSSHFARRAPESVGVKDSA